MKKLIYFLIVINVFIFTACQNDPIEKLSLKETFESLPIPKSISSSSGMNTRTSLEGGGYSVTSLYYKDSLLGASIYYPFQILNSDCATNECRYGILIIYNKEKSFIFDSEHLLGKSFFETGLGSYEFRQSNGSIYIKGYIQSSDKTGFTDIYFKYSIKNNEMTNELGQKL